MAIPPSQGGVTASPFGCRNSQQLTPTFRPLPGCFRMPETGHAFSQSSYVSMPEKQQLSVTSIVR